jgi:hypothetical protein
MTMALDGIDFVLLVGLVALLGAGAFIFAVDAWPRCSDERRIRKHLKN